MDQERSFYLELSEGSSHKFYEVLVKNAELTIRYGRIGDSGQVKTSTLASHEKALAEAQKKVAEKVRKGYENATKGVRQKRSVTRRASLLAEPAPSGRSSSQSRSSSPSARQSFVPTANIAPLLWEFKSGASAYGIFVDRERCWVGNEAGAVFALNHDGSVHAKFRLPDGVKAIVADGDWLYCGCDDGNVYDLTGKAPYVAYQISESVDIFWLDIFDAVLAVSDDAGKVTAFNHEDESQWTRQSPGSSGWMVRCDEIGVYHGYSTGVTMYDWEDGREIWRHNLPSPVLFGWQEEANLFAATRGGEIFSITKTGTLGPRYTCDHAVFSCASAENGKYVFAADSSLSLYCFRQNGERLWKLGTGCGVALSMQYCDERLYIVTNRGSLACIDASDAAIEAAGRGERPEARQILAPDLSQVASSSAIETTTDATNGVTLECYKDGGQLRVRVVSDGYHKDWHCQFPKSIREAGVRYVVDEVRESARGGFYRVRGTIRRLA